MQCDYAIVLRILESQIHEPTRDFFLEGPKLSKILLIEEILHQLIGSLSHYVQVSLHPWWCRISSINSIQIIIYRRSDLAPPTWTFLIRRLMLCRSDSSCQPKRLASGWWVDRVCEPLGSYQPNIQSTSSFFFVGEICHFEHASYHILKFVLWNYTYLLGVTSRDLHIFIHPPTPPQELHQSA